MIRDSFALIAAARLGLAAACAARAGVAVGRRVWPALRWSFWSFSCCALVAARTRFTLRVFECFPFAMSLIFGCGWRDESLPKLGWANLNPVQTFYFD